MKAFWAARTNSPGSSLTNYTFLMPTAGSVWGTNTTEATKSVPLSDDITVTGWTIWLDQAPGAGKSYTFTIRDDVADTAATMTISDTNTTGTWKGSVNIAAQSLCCVKSVPSGTPTSATQVSWIIEYKTAGRFYLMLMGNDNASSTSAGTFYSAMMGGSGYPPATSITNQEMICPANITITKISAYLSTAPGSGNTTTFVIRKNNTTDSTLSVAISDTNKQNNASGSFSVSAGDTIVYKAVAGPASAFSRMFFCATVVPEVLGEMIVMHSTSDSPSTTVTEYEQGIGSGGNDWNTTEATYATRFPAAVLKKQYVKNNTAPGAGKSRDIIVRDNGADTSLVTTLTTVTTGNNTTATVNHTANNTVNIKQVPTGTPAATTGTKHSMVTWYPQPTQFFGTVG